MKGTKRIIAISLMIIIIFAALTVNASAYSFNFGSAATGTINGTNIGAAFTSTVSGGNYSMDVSGKITCGWYTTGAKGSISAKLTYYFITAGQYNGTDYIGQVYTRQSSLEAKNSHTAQKAFSFSCVPGEIITNLEGTLRATFYMQVGGTVVTKSLSCTNERDAYSWW